MKNLYVFFSTAALVLCVMNGAWARQYVPNEGIHNDENRAIPIEDIQRAQAVPHTVTASTKTVWLRFDGTAGEVVTIQLAVPAITGLEFYRPAFALLGTAMPALANVPFTLPAGYGGTVYPTSTLGASTPSTEDTTGTTSWVFAEQTITLPADGTYYIVGYVPSDHLGKFWLGTGTVERREFTDILRLPLTIYQVRTFHQIFPIGGSAALIVLVLLVLVGPILLIIQLLSQGCLCG
ncbi:MAG: hypothetical protein KAH38_00295 [Candidatus Hydrogenedentes bacterium]|nr:hypothetical protein [Candidatus Hydrogenedentota bacterium]